MSATAKYFNEFVLFPASNSSTLALVYFFDFHFYLHHPFIHIQWNCTRYMLFKLNTECLCFVADKRLMFFYCCMMAIGNLVDLNLDGYFIQYFKPHAFLKF